MTSPLFRDRRHAGRLLAGMLAHLAHRAEVRVLALPRGGVPVAYEVAHALGAPLDVLVVRKLGVPHQEEFALGAIASGGVRVLHHALLRELAIAPEAVDAVTQRESLELQRRERLYRGGRPPADVTGHVAVLVDDGMATGATMRAAVAAVRPRQPGRIILAVPVAAPSSLAGLQPEADEVVCAYTPQPFHAVGLWYEDFTQTSDDEVRDLIARP